MKRWLLPIAAILSALPDHGSLIWLLAAAAAILAGLAWSRIQASARGLVVLGLVVLLLVPRDAQSAWPVLTGLLGAIAILVVLTDAAPARRGAGAMVVAGLAVEYVVGSLWLLPLWAPAWLANGIESHGGPGVLFAALPVLITMSAVVLAVTSMEAA